MGIRFLFIQKLISVSINMYFRIEDLFGSKEFGGSPILCKNKSESKNCQFQFLERIRIKGTHHQFRFFGGKKR